MKEKDTLIHSKLDKEVNLFNYHFTLGRLIDGTRLNARGRLHLDVVLMLFFLFSFIGDEPFKTGAFLSLLSLILPAIINKTTNYIINEFKVSKNNLYDFLLGIGTFAIVLGISVAVLFIACKFIYSNFVIPEKALIAITVIGLLGALVNLIMMTIQNHRK